ncbi:MAG TPA: hypothetical protein IGS53_22905 [Leptolyngbyaceae cyanobacterium M33_DOE_097]|uniref:Uncharacterized protein n=1 Tax=Oscillatoriales cyanobacterium SpSt-418 TaxID=2282169 RepID=A0A7C3PCM7_9CYAN|nr:hypothetical protein [Leptolyngbyaceae cyanobacterium M33_DOE_097]
MTQLDASALQARNRLITLFVLFCLLDIAVVILAKDAWAIIRILLTIALMYFVIQGRKWAKWLMIGLCSVLVVTLIALIIALSSRLSLTLIAGSAILGGLSAAIAIYIATNNDLNRYFAYKRHART